MFPKAITYVECVCTECGVVTKIPAKKITNASLSKEWVCPGCGNKLSDILDDAIKATVGYENVVSLLSSYSQSNIVHFTFE